MSAYFDRDFKAHLQADSAIVAFVGDRIFPLVVPQAGSIPALVYTLVDGQLSNSLDGFTSGMVNYAVQLDCWARTYEDAMNLSIAVRNRLNIAATSFNTVIGGFPSLSEFEPDTRRYRRMLMLSCWHHEDL